MSRPDLRFRVDPGDVPAEKAARRLHLTLAEFEKQKFALFDRGFPQPDPTTGNYDLDAIDRWRRARYPHLFPEAGVLTAPPKARDAQEVIGERLNRLAHGQGPDPLLPVSERPMEMAADSGNARQGLPAHQHGRRRSRD